MRDNNVNKVLYTSYNGRLDSDKGQKCNKVLYTGYDGRLASV